MQQRLQSVLRYCFIECRCRYFEGIKSGEGSLAGTGASIEVTPTATTDYTCSIYDPAQCVNDPTVVTVNSYEVPIITSFKLFDLSHRYNKYRSIGGVSMEITHGQTIRIQMLYQQSIIVSPDDIDTLYLRVCCGLCRRWSCPDTAQVLVNGFEALKD